MAGLCLRYLTFECFDPELPDQQLHRFLIDGYYSFQDYAVLHWVDHLESYIKSLPLSNLPVDNDFVAAVEDFYTVYGAGETNREDVEKELKGKLNAFPNTEYVGSVLLMVTQARKARKADEKMGALGELGQTIAKIRSSLENLSTSSTLETETRQQLEFYYGTQWSKCPRHPCFYFHEGFTARAQRDQHIDRHERPFCCTETGCPRILYGFISEKELKKHINVNHPDPSTFAWKFPKAKKESTKHQCAVCGKDYTRANSLRIHLRTHNNERPYNCKSCGKTFVRKHDCERHERLLHTDQKQAIGNDAMSSSQETL